MKIVSHLIFYILPLSLLLCAGLCCPTDDPPISVITIEQDNAIAILDNKTTFSLNDTLFVITKIDNSQLTTTSQQVNITDYLEQQNEVPALEYGLQLYKESSFGNDVKISVSNTNLIVKEGNINNIDDDDYTGITVRCPLIQDTFTNYFGIILKEKGRFYLANTNLEYDEKVVIYEGNSSKGYFIFSTTITHDDENGKYIFTVE